MDWAGTTGTGPSSPSQTKPLPKHMIRLSYIEYNMSVFHSSVTLSYIIIHNSHLDTDPRQTYSNVNVNRIIL